MERLLEINQETLTAIKRMGDVQDLKIAHLEKDNAELWLENRRASEARKEIYARVERIERRCAGLHGEARDRKTDGEASFSEQAHSWMRSELGRAVLWGVSIVATVVVTKWAGSF